MRARKNETTRKILGLLTKNALRVKVIAGHLGLTTQNIATTLNRLWKAGNVERRWVVSGVVVVDAEEGIERKGHCYVYSITQKGADRLKRIRGRVKP